MKTKTLVTRRLLTALLLTALASTAPSRLLAGAASDFSGGRDPFSGLPADFPDTIPCSLAVEAHPDDSFGSEPEKIFYLLPSQVEMSRVPPAPAAGSAVDVGDLAAVWRWQEERTEAQCAAANTQPDATFDNLFGAISPFGNPAPAEVKNIFMKVRTDNSSLVFLLKRKYKRLRPFQRDSAFIPCLDREGGYSYPSGHASAARIYGLMLSDLVPANAGVYMSYADQAGLNRVIGGVHHPSDVEAGKILGDAIYAALEQNRNFNTDMDTLRRNLKR